METEQMNVFPLVHTNPKSLLNAETISKLQNNMCPHCNKNLNSISFYRVVGRYKVVSHDEKIKFLEAKIERTTKYQYEGCYIPICEICGKKYRRVNNIYTFLSLYFYLGFVGSILLALIIGIFKLRINFPRFFIIFWVSLLISPFILAITSGFLTSGKFSKKTVVTNEEFPRPGVPDISNKGLREVMDKSELEKNFSTMSLPNDLLEYLGKNKLT
jgi:hypothetical protein